jgi:predicted nucleotidyltransferase
METTAADIVPEIVRRLVDKFDPEEIILFGSRAWGQPRSDSDYDLFVVVSDNGEPPLKQAVKAHSCLRGLGISKDVLVITRERYDRLSRVPASLEAKIRNQGVVLYGRRETATGPELASQGVT